MTGTARYPASLRVLHWVTALLIAAMVTGAMINRVVYEQQPMLAEAALRWHMTLGVVVALLMPIRLVERLRSAMQFDDPYRRLADIGHAALYLLIATLVVTGYLKMALLGFPVPLVAGMSLPALPLAPTTANLLKTAHQVLGITFGLVLIGHIAAAILHRRVFGTSVIGRML